MITTKFYLDTRRIEPGRPAPLRISITKKRQVAFIGLDVRILPSQWDKRKERIINHPDQLFLNTHIAEFKRKVDTILLNLTISGELARKTAPEIKERVLFELQPRDEVDKDNLFAARFLAFANRKTESTKGIYMHTYRRMQAFVGDTLERLTFEDITKVWLVDFERFLAKTSPSQNARNIHLRNIRAVFNEAMDDEITTAYPFRRFKIRPVETAKRSLKVEQLRALFSAQVEPHSEQYVDIFKLTFYLIGINIADLCHLKEIYDGRIEYNRFKTKRFYSVKVEPEALEIIEKYRGKGHLLNILDRYKDYENYRHRLNMNLRRIGDISVGKHGKKTIEPLFPGITSYWARHSWATIAASLDVPKETIAAALGHGRKTTTDIYIDFECPKIDVANRRVIDWVLYGRR